MRQQQRIVDAATRWAQKDRRIRALVLKGSLARGEADERSDVDLVVVAEPGCLEELWATRRSIAESLGGWLGGFDEVAWQRVLFGPAGLANSLRETLAAARPRCELDDLDSHAWDWLWAMHMKLRRPGEEWLVYVELVKFVETILVRAVNVLAAEPWRGVWQIEARLPANVVTDVRAALPSGPDEAELRRALAAALGSYLKLRARLATECHMPLNEELAAEVLPILRGLQPPIASDTGTP